MKPTLKNKGKDTNMKEHERTYYDITEMTPKVIVIKSNSPLYECGNETLRFTNQMVEDDYNRHGDTTTDRERTLSVNLAYINNKPYPLTIDNDAHLNIETDENDHTEVTGNGTKQITIVIKKRIVT